MNAGTLARRALGATVGLVALAALAAASHLTVGSDPTVGAIRLSLRTTAARLERCRERSDAELAALPVHRRQRRDCQNIAVDYRLRVRVDGVERLDRSLSHGGARRSRPLIIDEVLPVAPGRHRLEISLIPALSLDETTDASLAESLASLPQPRLDEVVTVPVGRLRLVTLADGETLAVAPAR